MPITSRWTDVPFSKKVCLYSEPGNESVAEAPCAGDTDFYVCGWRCEVHKPGASNQKVDTSDQH